MKEKILNVKWLSEPNVGTRQIKDGDDKIVITDKTGKRTTLLQDKINFPFISEVACSLLIQTTLKDIQIDIEEHYVYNGSDIPAGLEFFVGSKEDIRFLKGALPHDYVLEHKEQFKDAFGAELSTAEFRRLTSLMFREVIKNTGTGTIKANIMSWCVDVFQMTLNRRAWK
nr:MAG TPA: Protein of unknown function (DUF1353) [Caudoviricetes sp.]